MPFHAKKGKCTESWAASMISSNGARFACRIRLTAEVSSETVTEFFIGIIEDRFKVCLVDENGDLVKGPNMQIAVRRIKE